MPSLSACLPAIESSLKENFRNKPFTITGNVTEYYESDTGIALTLVENTMEKDYQLKVYIFNNILRQVNNVFSNNQQIEVTGIVSIYQNTLQLIATKIKIIDQLKTNIIPNNVLPCTLKHLPEIFAKLAIITSENSQGYEDFVKNLKYGKLIPFYTKMQGSGSPQDMVKSIEKINRIENFDAICIVRGGGSSIDLDAFNSPALAAAIQQSTIPVLTAIGHESNKFLCDEASDNPENFSTPTALANYLNNYHDNLLIILKNKIVRTISFTTKFQEFPFPIVIPSLVALYLINKYLIK